MVRCIQPATLALCLAASAAAAQNLFTVELTRFGGCLTPPGGCIVEIADNGALDSNPALHVIDFAVPLVGQAPATFSASGHATEVITHDAAGRAIAILMTLTASTVIGQSGAIIPGQIGLISSEPLVSFPGTAGFAGLAGEYRSFTTGVIGHADVMLQARAGGLLLGLVDPAAANGAASPLPFSGFDARAYPDIPVTNLLLGVLDFEASSGSGFFLPGSGEVFAQAIPEPSSGWLLGIALAAGWLRWRQVARRQG